MIPKNARYCAILMASAPFSQHKAITEYGRQLAVNVGGDYGRIKLQLEHRFGGDFAIKTGAFQAAVATANLTFNGLGHLTVDARLGTIATRKPASMALLHDTFFDSGYRLAVICGQKAAFMEMLGVIPELTELRSCQALIVFLDHDGLVVSKQMLVPSITVFRRIKWSRRESDAVVQLLAA